MITIAAALTVAVAAQAASIDWAVNGANVIKNQAGNNIGAGAAVYLVLADSVSDIISAINAGSFSSSTTGVLGSSVTSAQSNVARVTAESALLTRATSYTYTVLVFNEAYTGTAGSIGNYLFFGTVSQLAYDPLVGDPATSALFTTPLFQSGTGWQGYTVVPEPTAMALVALGVAAVGLRRRFRK